jgi:hypothetical protein
MVSDRTLHLQIIQLSTVREFGGSESHLEDPDRPGIPHKVDPFRNGNLEQSYCKGVGIYTYFF